MMEIELTCPYTATEDHEKVVQAVVNLFPDAILDIDADILTGTASSLDGLIKKINEQKIRDTARQVLYKGISTSGISFFLNKQAAYASKVNFSDGDSVLGDIGVSIKIKDPGSVLDELLPSTVREKKEETE